MLSHILLQTSLMFLKPSSLSAFWYFLHLVLLEIDKKVFCALLSSLYMVTVYSNIVNSEESMFRTIKNFSFNSEGWE